MAVKHMNGRFRIKCDTFSRWLNNNKVVYQNEIVAIRNDDNTVELKVGDGINTFFDLPYLNTPLWDGIFDHYHYDYLPVTMGVYTPTATTRRNYDGYLYVTRLYSTYANDYAEFRPCRSTVIPGNVVVESPEFDGVTLCDKRMTPGASVVSDTFGFSVGQINDTDVPVAVSGRVLADTDKPRRRFKVGDIVCSGKNGTVSKMRRWEAILRPECIIGTVSHIPEYADWHGVPVNNRIWIKLR